VVLLGFSHPQMGTDYADFLSVKTGGKMGAGRVQGMQYGVRGDS
jgi:hypothetical protein